VLYYKLIGIRSNHGSAKRIERCWLGFFVEQELSGLDRGQMAERDASGRFVKGHKGGPGRPKKKREERYYEIAVSAISFNQWKKIIQKAGEQAQDGDASARRFLADYLLPTPAQRLELTGALGGPIEISQVDEVRSNLERKLLEAVDAEPEEGVS